MTGAGDRPAGGPNESLEEARRALCEARRALERAEGAVERAEREGGGRTPGEVRVEGVEWTWRAKLWAAPAETRVGMTELREALGVSESWVYARTKNGADPRLPHRKLGGTLQFVVGEIRAWIRTQEEVPLAGRMWSPATEGGLGVVEGRGGAP